MKQLRIPPTWGRLAKWADGKEQRIVYRRIVAVCLRSNVALCCPRDYRGREGVE